MATNQEFSVLTKNVADLTSRVECLVLMGLDGQDGEILADLIYQIDELVGRIGLLEVRETEEFPPPLVLKRQTAELPPLLFCGLEADEPTKPTKRRETIYGPCTGINTLDMDRGEIPCECGRCL